jgi:hypothetical protein
MHTFFHAVDHLGVPKLLSSDDFISDDCDELSRMTYIAQYRKYYGDHQAEIDARVSSGLTPDQYLASNAAKEEVRSRACMDA